MKVTISHFGSVSASPTSEVYLVGGGPSLSGFPLHRLASKTVFCVNDSILSMPWAYAVVSADTTWIRKRSSTIASFTGHKYFVASEPGSEKAVWLEKVRAPALSGVNSAIHLGGTSGYAALNIAFLAGAKTIHLLGYDYQSPGQHWHENYSWKSAADSSIWGLWAKMFEATIPQLTTAGVQVYNYNPDSKVTAFEKRTLEQLPLEDKNELDVQWRSERLRLR